MTRVHSDAEGVFVPTEQASSPVLGSHFLRMAVQLVDSALASTREFWRVRYFDASPEEAADPRPFAQILAERATQ